MTVAAQQGQAAQTDLGKDADASKFAAEIAVMAWRLEALAAVATSAGDNTALQEVKSRIGKEVPMASAAGGAQPDKDSDEQSSTAAARAARLRAAPSPTFASIETLSAFAASGLAGFSLCKTEGELKAHQEKIKVGKTQQQELLSSVRTAVQDAYLARRALRQAALNRAREHDKQRAKLEGAKDGKERQAKRPKVAFSIFNAERPDSTNIPEFSQTWLKSWMRKARPDDIQDLFSGPFIIRGTNFARAAEGDPAGDTPLHQELSEFKQLFTDSPQCRDGGRAALAFTHAEATKAVLAEVRATFPEGWIVAGDHPTLPPDLVAAFKPSCFGFAANSVGAAFEKSFAASFRVATTGPPRKVVLGRFTEVGDFVRTLKEKDGDPVSGPDTFEWLRGPTPEDVSLMLRGSEPLLAWGTLDVGDALYTPAGAAALDQTGPKATVGFRIPVVATPDAMAAGELAACAADWTQRCKQPHPVAGAMLAYIAVLGAEAAKKAGGDDDSDSPKNTLKHTHIQQQQEQQQGRSSAT